MLYTQGLGRLRRKQLKSSSNLKAFFLDFQKTEQKN